MKTKSRTILLISLVITGILLVECKKSKYYLPASFPISTDVVTQRGGVVRGLNGNVVLTIPDGALAEPAIITVSDTLFLLNSESYLLRPIAIGPDIEFLKPAKLEIRYDGCLSNDWEICEGMNIHKISWRNDEDLSNGPEPCYENSKEFSVCCVKSDCNVIRMCISRTGVIAIDFDTKAENSD